MKKRAIFALCAASAFPVVVYAHANIAVEEAFSLGQNSREYLEGSSTFIRLNLPHDCAGQPTQHMAMQLPDFSLLPDAEFSNKGSVLVRTKVAMTANWNRNYVFRGTTFGTHWRTSLVDNDHYDNLEFRVGALPKFHADSCVNKLIVGVPAVQYCRGKHLYAWTAETPTPSTNPNPFAAAVPGTSFGYVATFSVVRNAATNPLPAACGGVGTMLEISPRITANIVSPTTTQMGDCLRWAPNIPPAC